LIVPKYFRAIFRVMITDFGLAKQLGSDAGQTEVGDLGHVADQLIADVVRLGEVVPFVRKELLDREREALVVAVDVDDARLDRIALLQHLVGMFEPAVPRHVGDVN